jgi:sodium/hydrogen antiporter
VVVLELVLAAGGLVALFVAVFFRALQRWSISPPLLGLVTGVLLGPEVLGVLSVPSGDETHVMRIAAQLLLAVALMATSLRYPISTMRARIVEVALLVVVVLPAMTVIVAGSAVWMLQLPLGIALVLGASLSPTDPVLASGIATGEQAERDVPARARQVLSLESGANDGLAMPLVGLSIAMSLDRSVGDALLRGAYEVVAAVVFGALVGAVAGRALRWAKRHREIGASARALYPLVLAAFVLGASGLLHADGLLSVFVAGLAHNQAVAGGDREVEVGIDEALNQFLVVPVFVLFGAVLPWVEWTELGWGGLLFMLAALLLRRLPALLALKRPLRADWTQVIWLGWFGPIGVAALFYLGHADEQGVTDPSVWTVGTLVITLSTVVHGLTAARGRLAYRRHLQRTSLGRHRPPDRG